MVVSPRLYDGMNAGSAYRMTVRTIIVAGGAGKRMGGEQAKQYLLLGGIPILMRTIERFLSLTLPSQTIVLVVPPFDMDYVEREIISPAGLCDVVKIVPGGEKRQDSVWNGLTMTGGDEDITLIHDGVRPFVTERIIMNTVEEAAKSGAAIAGIPVSDTVKRVNNAGTIFSTVDRSGMWLAQTPQAFQTHLIMKAYESAVREGYTGTDDASLVEKRGHTVTLVYGSRINIKITTPEDIRFGEWLLRQ